MQIELNLSQILTSEALADVKAKAEKMGGIPHEVAAFLLLNDLVGGLPKALTREEASKPPYVEKAVVAPPAKKSAAPPVVKRPTPTPTSGNPPATIEDLDLPTRAYNLLKKADRLNAQTIEAFMALTPQEILDCKGAGAKTKQDIADKQKEVAAKWPNLKVVASVFPPEEDEPVPPTNAGTYQSGYIQQFDELDHFDSKNVRRAGRLFREATGESKDVVRSMLAEVYREDDPDTYYAAIETLKNHLPVQLEQVEHLFELAEKLGETKRIVEQDRPLAAFGHPLRELSVGEVQQLIEEMEDEAIKTRTSVTTADVEDDDWNDLFP